MNDDLQLLNNNNQLERLENEESVYSLLTAIQLKLFVPKEKKNNFAGFVYRSVEDINKAVKQLIPKGAAIWVCDDLMLIGDRYYIKSTITLKYKGEEIKAIGWAREQLNQKGKDESQVTGSCQSYARKYAFQAMFLIDDEKEDVDKSSGPNPADKAKNISQEARQLINTIVTYCNNDDENARLGAVKIWAGASGDLKKESWAHLNKQVQDWVKSLMGDKNEQKR